MNESLYERIKLYKNGLLSISEQQAFEDQMRSDPEFAHEVSVWASVQKGIQEEGDAQMQDQLFELGLQLLHKTERDIVPEATTPSGNAARRIPLPRRFWAAAAAVLLLLTAYWGIQRLNPPAPKIVSSETLYNNYFTVLPVSGERDAGATTWKEVYTQKRYNETIVLLEALLKDPAYTSRSEANLYLGLAYMGDSQIPLSITAFQQVSEGSYLWEHAQWYESLALIKTGDTKAAREKLQTIEKQPGIYRQKATELLQQLQ